MKGRQIQRGKPLEEFCYKAHISKHEYGMNDDRCFCYGVIDLYHDDLKDECKNCGAYVDNAEPFEEVSE